MKVTSLTYGFVLVFDSASDLAKHINNLKGQLEWVLEKQGAGEPTKVAYAVYDDPKYDEQVKAFLATLPDVPYEKEA